MSGMKQQKSAGIPRVEPVEMFCALFVSYHDKHRLVLCNCGTAVRRHTSQIRVGLKTAAI